MAREQLTEFLQTSGFIDPVQAVEIAGCFMPKTIGKHAFLLQAGRISDEYLFLDRGLLRAFVLQRRGRRRDDVLLHQRTGSVGSGVVL